MDARAVVFWAPKGGNAEDEWEDGAGGVPPPMLGGPARYIVVDGATEAYDSIRWVDHLISTFLDASTAPILRREFMGDWLAHSQRRWLDEAPPRVNYIEERKFAEGSFATVLCCELIDLTGPQPGWRAAALGDAVLFHVRAGELRRHFPELSVEDFGTNPDGAHTDPDRLGHMVGNLLFDEAPVQAGDLIYLVTDAVAQWMLRLAGQHPRTFWHDLAHLHHPLMFEKLVQDHRAAGLMNNDDVTLIRLTITADPLAHLVTCLP